MGDRVLSGLVGLDKAGWGSVQGIPLEETSHNQQVISKSRNYLQQMSSVTLRFEHDGKLGSPAWIWHAQAWELARSTPKRAAKVRWSLDN